MIHYGDVCKIDGAKIPKVDIITFGAPCQDLSVAGKRAGMKSALMGDEETTRSGLFFEAIRIIKEMREDDRKNGKSEIRPRYAVYENVPGAFSSNKGEDFRTVLEETAKVADKDAVIPEPPKGKWSPSGCIVGDGWSIAWRVHDAQFWGVPQRRKRIALVADFGGTTAPEILFERKGMSGDLEEGGKEREGAAADVGTGVKETGGTISFQERAGKPGGGKGILIQNERVDALSTANCQAVLPINTMVATRTTDEKRTTFGIGADGDPQFSLTATHEHGVACLNDQGGGVMSVSVNVSGTLRAQEHGHHPIVYGISAYDSNAMKSSNPHSGIYQTETSRTLDLNGGSPACNQGGMAVVAFAQNQRDEVRDLNDKSGSLSAQLGMKQQTYVLQGSMIGRDEKNGPRGNGINEDVSFTLNTSDRHAVVVENHPADSHVKISEDGVVQTLSSRMGTGGGNVPMVLEPYTSSKTSYHQHFSVEEEKIGAQVARGPGAVCQSIDCSHADDVVRVGEVVPCMQGRQSQGGNNVFNQSVVRRLTPLECERLQGFPDHWTDIGDWVDSKGKKHKEADSCRYKALGNSIALPFWEWMAKRMVAYLGENPTMVSLFSGIGGFELVFARAGCKPVWNSEIESYPEAVTRVHFGDDEKGIKGDYEKYL